MTEKLHLTPEDEFPEDLTKAQASPRIAGSPSQTAESVSFSYGPPVRLRLLPTRLPSPHGPRAEPTCCATS